MSARCCRPAARCSPCSTSATSTWTSTCRPRTSGRSRSAATPASCSTPGRIARSPPRSRSSPPRRSSRRRRSRPGASATSSCSACACAIDADLLRRHAEAVRSGLPGLAYVRTDPAVAWPERLQPKASPMTGEQGAVVARLAGVTHRYGATRALDGVTLDIPAGRMVGVIGPDGVGKSSLLGDRRRGAARAGRRGRGARRRHDRCGASQRGLSAHRLHAAGARQEPLSRPQRAREHRVLRPAVRPGARRARGAHRRSARQHRARAVPGPAGQEAVRRHAAEARAVLLARSTIPICSSSTSRPPASIRCRAGSSGS